MICLTLIKLAAISHWKWSEIESNGKVLILCALVIHFTAFQHFLVSLEAFGSAVCSGRAFSHNRLILQSFFRHRMGKR